MKKYYSLLLAGCMVFGLAAASMAADKQTVSLVASEVMDDNFIVEYEKPFKGKTSLIFNGGIIGAEEDGVELSGFVVGGGYRQYINEVFKYKAGNLEGFFAEGFGQAAMIDTKWHEEKEDQVVLTIGGLFGWKYMFDGGLTLEAAAGPTYAFGDDFHGYEPGFDAKLVLKAGYSW